MVADTETTPGAVFTVAGMTDPAGTRAFLLGVIGTVRHNSQLFHNTGMDLYFSVCSGIPAGQNTGMNI